MAMHSPCIHDVAHAAFKRPIRVVVLMMAMRRRRKFTTSIQPAEAYEDESVMLSGPH